MRNFLIAAFALFVNHAFAATPEMTGIKLDGSSSGSTTLNAAASGSTITIKLPSAAGSSGDFFTHSSSTDTAWISPTTATAAMIACVGDSGSGGTKGLVPAPGSGDAAAGKFLKADCTFAVPSGGVASTITVGTTTVGSGASSRVLFDNTTLGEAAGFTFDGTSVLTLGVAGSSVGGVVLKNATSGAITINPPTGALGTVTVTIPANTGTIAELNLAQTYTAVQSYNDGDFKLNGSSSGATTLKAAATAGTTTIMFPAATDTVAVLGTAQTFTATQSVSVETISAGSSTLTPSGAKNDYVVTLVHANTPFTLANMTSIPPANTHGIIRVIQSSTGTDLISTWGSAYQAPGGTATIVLSTGANAIDILAYVSDGTNIYLTPLLAFSH